MSFDYDLFVIGGGSGGVRAARIASGEYGARVGLAEESRMGGTCVIRGCVPKKLMVFASEARGQAREMQAYGWTGADAGDFDWAAFRERLDRELDRLEGAYTSGLTAAGVEIHHSRATVVDPHTVALSDGSRLRARHILIAVGGRPSRLDIPGAKLGLVSDDIFNLPELPRRALFIGSGFIACEFASVYQGFGVETSLSCRRDKVLRGFDEQMRGLVTAQLQENGVNVLFNSSPARIDRDGDALRVTYQDGRTGLHDAIFFATGRAPHTGGLGLEAAGVALGRKGEVLADEWAQTSVPSIYAVGDVTDRINLTPVAIRQGHNFADTVFGGLPRPSDLSLVASAVYTRPHELATIGLTEEEARDQVGENGPVAVYEASFRAMRSLFAGSEARTVMKLIVDDDSDRVLGCHLFGPDAAELIQLVAVAMGMGATKADFSRTIAVHPTMAEELVTLRGPVRRHDDTAGTRDGEGAPQ